ncbi:MAG: outer membrane protein assembly factor BamA [Deltaproteobacteria bacterium]|nr:outer membrane protein assembly factor BamA [Deltaproteobacteria bacterium]
MRSILFLHFFVLASLLSPFNLLAQSESGGGEKIVGIQVVGNQGAEREAILATIRSRTGQFFSRSRIREDIAALFKMGVFDEIQVEQIRREGGIVLIYRVVEKTNITKIVFKGNKKAKEDKLRELIDLKSYTSIDAGKLAASVRKIRTHYEEEGYQLVKISTEYKPDPESGGQELIFHINENEPIRLRRVRFIGNKAFSDKNLRKLLKSKQKSRWSWLTSSGKYKEELIQRDIAFLIYHYQNHGYLKVRVTAPQVYLSKDRKWLDLTFHVTEGVPYTIRTVDIQGDLLTTRQELISGLKTKPNQLYSREKLEEDLQRFSALYGDQGYAFALINPHIEADDESRTADITFLIEKGKKVTIEKINISGNNITRDKVVRRELLVKENTLYNETRLRESRRRIEALGFFEEVNFATPRGSSDDQIVLNITVKEKPTGTFTIGAGFSSAENFIFNAAIAKNNFFGYGVSGQLSMELSSKRKLFILSAEDPYFLDTNWILGVSGFRTENVFSDFDRRSFGGSLTLGHRIFDYSSFRFMYQIEDVSLGDFRTTVPAKFNQNLSGLSSSATVSLQRDTRNNRLFPSSGMFQNVAGEFAGLGGDNRFARVTENFRYYQPIWKDYVVGKLNVTIGNISSLDDNPVPLFERFFMGGINSLRGYTLRSIGPSVQIPSTPEGGDSQFIFGGNKMLQLNLELELPLYIPAGFKAVTFMDSGQAYSEEQNISLTTLRYNYGFGFRWNSPVGPLRFEWGIPIKKQAGDDPVVFNFAIGSFF